MRAAPLWPASTLRKILLQLKIDEMGVQFEPFLNSTKKSREKQALLRPCRQRHQSSVKRRTRQVEGKEPLTEAVIWH